MYFSWMIKGVSHDVKLCFQIDNAHLFQIDMVVCAYINICTVSSSSPFSATFTLYLEQHGKCPYMSCRAVISNVTSCQNIESPFHICFLNFIYYIEKNIALDTHSDLLRKPVKINACVFSAEFLSAIVLLVCTQCALYCPLSSSLLWRSPSNGYNCGD